MRYDDLHRLYAATPVTSTSRPRRTTRPSPPPGPSVGARWGKASAFSWSREAAGDREGMTVEGLDAAPRAFMRVVGTQAKIMSQRVRVEDPGDPASWIEVDRMTRIAFAYTEFPPKPTAASPQPSRTTVYDLALVLHPEDEVVV